MSMKGPEGQPPIESLAERAARLKRDQEIADAQERFATSSEGLKSADNAYGALVDALKRGAAEISGAGISCTVEGTQRTLHCGQKQGSG